ncbi:glycosyltransferase family 2 protein [Sediminitomix flava]|uniref:Glycosyltransferase involved in cell wall biosynthesis n=1 Tax=Sediminitomix flava TaxID=379075 RepID=A0A315ZFK8_SEDFL|nr:glycosyltransferase family 2 protein [Sediminitomix flava]PWJ44355.1 glycosyltransferase involved in cell wall biosynthesis [Sediminitomix flava]
MTLPKITAIIPTKNEEHNIREVLESVSFADEIMVVDSFSTDRTVEIAKEYTDFILQREYENSASQKNWAIPQATHEWIVLVDADERVTKELELEIKEILKGDKLKAGYWIYRRNHFLGKEVKYSGWQNDRVIRLFQKSKCRYEDKHVHAEIIADGEVGKLKNRLIHNTYVSFDHYLAKLNRYAAWQAEDYSDTQKITFYHLGIKPAVRFFKHFILQRGYKDGMIGFIIAYCQSYAVASRYIRLWISRNTNKK